MELDSSSIKTTINTIIDEISGDFVFDETKLQLYFSNLEGYECWQPYFRLLSRCIDEQRFRKVEYYIRLARIHNLVFNDPVATAAVCARLIVDLELSYTAFQAQALAEIVSPGDYIGEASILDRVFPIFTSKEDLITCLERLCFIFEKKRHNEGKLNEYYERLLGIDPCNIKALRYFKGVYTQANDWTEVIRILEILSSQSQRTSDKHLAAQEMATIYQYQMDLPLKALETIENLCAESPLDTALIRFDAFTRLRDWGGCIDTLNSCLIKADSHQEKAIIHLKMGELYERQARPIEAFTSYQACLRYNPELLEAYEKLIYHSLRDLDWLSTVKHLELLRSQLKNRNLAKKLSLLSGGIKKMIDDLV